MSLHKVTHMLKLQYATLKVTQQDKKTVTAANHLFSDIMLKFGFPTILHSDNGTEFKYKLIGNLSLQLGIRKIFILPQHQQANGKLESSHRFIKDYPQ